MSIKIMTAVWEKSKASGTDLVVLLALSDSASDDGECYPGIKTLARKARVSERSVQYSLKRLVDLGELDISYKSSKYETNIYRVLLGGANPAPGVVQNNAGGGAKGCTRVVQTSAPNTSVEPSERNNTNTLSVSHSPRVNRRELDEGFEKWYAVYPRKVSPDNAKSAWFKINPTGEQVDRMIEVLRWHIKVERWDEMAKSPAERKFIPHPATYLNGGRWKEEPEELSDKSKYESGFYF